MFVTENKIVPLPSKRVIEDVITRYGEADEYSFTPWRGCKDIFDKNFADDANVSVYDVINGQVDFSAHKSRPTDDGVNRDLPAGDIGDYYTALEDIQEDFIRKYITNLIVGFKLNKNGLRSKNIEEDTYKLYHDEENDEYADPNDVIEDAPYFTTSEIVEAKMKIPYLLKQLHSGSISMRGSLLSFIIAYEKCMANIIEVRIAPRHIVAAGVYRVDGTGKIVGRFSIEENTGKVLPALVKWVCGADPNNLYYKAYKELIKCLDILGIDIKKEDARDYTPEVIQKAVCTYLATNEEYLETYGYYDKKVRETLTPDKLFKAARRISGDNSLDMKVSKSLLCDNIADNIKNIEFDHPRTWHSRPSLVMEFLTKYTQKHSMQSIGSNLLEEEKGLIKLRGGDYVTLRVDELTGNNAQTVAVIATDGYLIKVKSYAGLEYEVYDLADALDYYNGGNLYEWQSISI